MKITMKRALSLLLILISVLTMAFGSTAYAATPLTSLGLGEYGIKAYHDGWIYIYGNAGQTVSGRRSSDCSGLIHAYFSDNGASGPRTVTQQANSAVQSGNLSTGIPRIHGLIITIPNYDHVGIYIGGGEEVDNSEPSVDMLWGHIYNSSGGTNRRWLKWHMMGGRIKYPTNGFYTFNGKVYHYTNRQYDINTTVKHGNTTYRVGADGVVYNPSGSPVSPSAGLPNDGFADAKAVTIDGKGNGAPGANGDYSGSNGGNGPPLEAPDGDPATVTGDVVNVRSAAKVDSNRVTQVYEGETVYVTDTVTGDSVTSEGKTTDKWHKINTLSGKSGYICALYVDYGDDPGGSGGETETPAPPTVPENVNTPVIAFIGGRVTMDTTTSGASIYFTTDVSTPSATNGSIYANSLSHSRSTTYRAIAIKDGKSSDVATVTIFSNGALFTDITTDKWYFPHVEAAVLSSIFNGSSKTTFSPNANIKRGDFVVALANLTKVDLTSYAGKKVFDDVPSDTYYAAAIAWASEKGYVDGMGDNLYKPKSAITREQMCTILAKYAGLERSDESALFDDHASISSWAHDAVYACRDFGLVNGVGANNFAPQKSTTRAETAKVMVSYVQK